MATKKNKSTNKNKLSSWKPGSDPAGAKNTSSEDFGVPAGPGSETDRQYTSENTKHSDPGAAMPAAWEHDGVRDHGAGAPDSGTGSASGGDVDTDLIGFTSKPQTNQAANHTRQVGGDKRVKGSVISSGNASSPYDAEGSDAANNSAAEDDDSFAGEVSRGEARGEDNSLGSNT